MEIELDSINLRAADFDGARLVATRASTRLISVLIVGIVCSSRSRSSGLRSWSWDLPKSKSVILMTLAAWSTP